MKILIIDDNVNMCYLLRDYFEQSGHTVDMAHSAPAALQKINLQKPNAVILNILMSGLTGFQIIGAIRREPKTADIPIIISSITDGPAEDGKRLAIVDFLRKPFDTDKFEEIIKTLSKKKEQPKILIIEDNEEDIKLIEILLLKQHRCTVLKAADGAAGFKLAQEEIPDLILMDYMLPVKDGLELSKELKKSQKTSNIPIVLITAYMPSNMGKKSFLLGNGDSGMGSFTFKELLEKIDEFLKNLES